MQGNQGVSPIIAHINRVSTADAANFIHFFNSWGMQVAVAAIAEQLSKIPLLEGQELAFYSYAQHRVAVSAACEESLRKEALFLDVAPAIFNNILKLTKTNTGADFVRLEGNFESAIASKFGLDFSKPAKRRIKKYELDVLEMEHDALTTGSPKPGFVKLLSKFGPSESTLHMPKWQPAVAKNAFLISFYELFK